MFSLHELDQIRKDVAEECDINDKQANGMMILADSMVNRGVDRLLEQMDNRFDVLDKRFDVMDKRFDTMDKRMNDGFTSVDSKFKTVEQEFVSLNRWMPVKCAFWVSLVQFALVRGLPFLDTILP